MPTESKGVRDQQRLRQIQMKRMRNEGKSWKEIAKEFKMDKSNARRSILRKHKQKAVGC